MNNISLSQAGSFSFLFLDMIGRAMAANDMTHTELREKVYAYFATKFPTSPHHARTIALATFRRFTDDQLDARSAGAIIEAMGLEVEITLKWKEQPRKDSETIPQVSSYPAIWDEKIDHLQLPVRVENCLKYGLEPGIEYIGQLVSQTEEQLMKVVNFGKTSMRRLNEALVRHGLILQTDTGNWKVPSQVHDGKYPQIWNNRIDREPSLIGYPAGCLRNAGIHYIGQLVALHTNELPKLVGVGKSTELVIRMTVQNLGLEFNTNTEGWKPPQ